jgi:hypothetical protein
MIINSIQFKPIYIPYSGTPYSYELVVECENLTGDVKQIYRITEALKNLTSNKGANLKELQIDSSGHFYWEKLPSGENSPHE